MNDPAWLQVTLGDFVGDAARWVTLPICDGVRTAVFHTADLDGDCLRVHVESVEAERPDHVLIRLPPTGKSREWFAVVRASSLVEDSPSLGSRVLLAMAVALAMIVAACVFYAAWRLAGA